MKTIKIDRDALWSAFVTLSAIDIDSRDEHWEVASSGIKAALNEGTEFTEQQSSTGGNEMKLELQARGMSIRQYAAIKLKVADSGVDWLDEMITKSKRDDIAANTLQGLLNSKVVATPEDFAKGSYKIADAMLKAR